VQLPAIRQNGTRADGWRLRLSSEEREVVVKKILLALMAFVLAVGLAFPVMAYDEEVDTSAKVGGAGSAPFICAKFETPDDSVDAGTQILPNAGMDKVVKFYVVLGDPNTVDDIASVDVTVFYPDGTEKFQLRAIRGTWTLIPWDGLIDMDGDCAGDTAVADAMADLDAQGRIAYGPGQTLDTVLYDLEKGKQLLIELVGSMDYHQPSADYTVEAKGTDKGGNTGEGLTNTFFYMSIVALKIDFDRIDFGTLNIDDWNIVYGDADMATPNRPTVQNIGNDPARLVVHATPLTGAVMGKTIEDFDVMLLDTRVEFKACEDTEIPVDLPPCTPTQIDFSVHPPYGTPQDDYSGKMHLTIIHAP
jgi:hypothetical protein